jgi:diguanylate cyclase (GGDEF)-like protein
MIRTIARLLMKTSRRSDLVAHYGNGVFAMILKHTDLKSAEKASERLCELVSSSNFFLAEREINLKISIGIKAIMAGQGVEEQVINAVDAMTAADKTTAGYKIHEEPDAPEEESEES